MSIYLKNGVITVISLIIAFSVNAKDISQIELVKQMGSDDKPLIIDVRTIEEFNAGHIPGAINIPHLQIKTRMNDMSGLKDKDIVLYCRSGRRAIIAKDEFASGGFSKLTHLAGDFNDWSANKMPTEIGNSQGLAHKVN